MKRTFAVLILFFLSGCSFLGIVQPNDKLDLYESIFRYAFNNSELQSSIKTEAYFLEVKGVRLNSNFFKRFKNVSLAVRPMNLSTESCSQGVVDNITHNPGLVFRIFKVVPEKENIVDVKWGYWMNRKKYSYRNTKFKFSEGRWEALVEKSVSHC